jgi:catechol-2,3-dioxygenase
MLGDHPIDVVLLATDLEPSKEFYAGKLGLEILNENEDAITYKCGGDSQLAVTKSTTGTADEQTQAGWRVDDLEAEHAELRSRGVEHAAEVGQEGNAIADADDVGAQQAAGPPRS